jgi:hypothetical protein
MSCPDFAADPDLMGAENLVDFAVERGRWGPEGGEPFGSSRSADLRAIGRRAPASATT